MFESKKAAEKNDSHCFLPDRPEQKGKDKSLCRTRSQSHEAFDSKSMCERNVNDHGPIQLLFVPVISNRFGGLADHIQ